MKKIEAIIKPFKLDEVTDALIALGVHGMTVSDVNGFGRQKGRVELHHGAEYVVNFIPKIGIEVVVADDMAERVICTIREKTQSGQIGDGKIFVTNLADAVRVRTGERGETAL